jgi:hypothetical protein
MANQDPNDMGKFDFLETYRHTVAGFAHRRGSDEARECADQLERAFCGETHDPEIRAEVRPLVLWLRSKDDRAGP